MIQKKGPAPICIGAGPMPYKGERVLWDSGDGRRRAGNRTLHGLVNLDIISRERLTGSSFQFIPRPRVGAERRDFGRLRGRQVALRLNHKEDGGGAQRILLLFGVE